MYKDITAVILSGGKSRRMGVNKSFMKIGSQTVIEIISEIVKPLFEKVILITDTPDKYSLLNLITYSDIYLNKGPLGGIHAGLTRAATDKIFVITCDVPLMKPEMIKYIVDYPSEKPVKVARAGGFVQQLCGVYSKPVLPAAEIILNEEMTKNETQVPEQKNRKCMVLNLLNRVDAEIINPENNFPGFNPEWFINMNTPDDFELVLRRISGL